MGNRLIRVFEYETLRFPGERDGIALTEFDFTALARFHAQVSGRYFRLLHRAVRFGQYVGILQVGELTLEILPKADREPGKPEHYPRWQGVLLDMLRECRLLRTETAPGQARLQQWHHSLLDIYLRAFLHQTERLLRRGLIKQYHPLEENQSVLRGSIRFGAHLRRNLVHQERFYVRHTAYDTSHLIHQLLYEALRLVPQLTTAEALREQARHLYGYFPTQRPVTVSPGIFETIRPDRRTQPYREALQLARLILLGYQPDVRGGRHHSLALLFDMNRLFEEYIYRQLRKCEDDTLQVERQQSTYFWMQRSIRPDIVIRRRDAQGQEISLVVDTKWKVLRTGQPDDEDLKQAYVYNQHYGASKTVLVYPAVHPLQNFYGAFHLPNPFLGESATPAAHGCQLVFVELLENGRLRPDLGRELLQRMQPPSLPA